MSRPVLDGLIWAPIGAFSRGLPPVPAMAFEAERAAALRADAPPGFIALDISDRLECPYPATTPMVLARYLILARGAVFSHSLDASGEVFYVIAGEGVSEKGGDSVAWRAGDAFCLPGGGVTRHRATARALLFLVTNEPELAFGGHAMPPSGRSTVQPAVFRRDAVNGRLAEVKRGPDNQAAGAYVNITVPAQEAMRTILPSMVVGFNTLEPGTNQRPHRHNAAAITLTIDGEAVHSMIDGRRFDWMPHGVLLTPPNAVHSHHNLGPAMMKSFVAQDGGIFHYCRATDFEYRDGAG